MKDNRHKPRARLIIPVLNLWEVRSKGITKIGSPLEQAYSRWERVALFRGVI